MQIRKIIFAFVLMAALSMSMIAPAAADDEAAADEAGQIQCNIVIHPADSSDTSDPERFVMYQLTVGSVADTAAAQDMAAVTWGSGIDGVAFYDDIKDEQAFAEPLAAILNYYEPEEDLGDMSGVISALLNKNGALNEALASVAADHISQAYGATAWDSAANVWTFSTGQPGLYLMVDSYIEPEFGGTDDKAAPFILPISGDMDLSIVAYTPDLGKTANFSENAYIDAGTGITYDVTGYLPGDYADYASFRLVFHETADPGILINEKSVSVTADRNVIKPGEDTYTVEKTENEDGSTSMDIIFPDVKSGTLGLLSGMSSIQISYNAVIDGDMPAGVEKHCYSQLEYPTALDGSGTGYSARADGSVCTLGMELHTEPGGSYVLQDFLDNYAVLQEAASDEGSVWQITKWRDEAQDATTLYTSSDGVLRIAGLGCSVYMLHELKAPEGASMAPDVIFSTDIITDAQGSPGRLVTELEETEYATISSEEQERVFSISLTHEHSGITDIPAQQDVNEAEAEQTAAPAEDNASLTGEKPSSFVPIVICCVLAAVGYAAYKIIIRKSVKGNKH